MAGSESKKVNRKDSAAVRACESVGFLSGDDASLSEAGGLSFAALGLAALAVAGGILVRWAALSL